MSLKIPRSISMPRTGVQVRHLCAPQFFLGHTEIVELLVAAGVDVNQPNRDLATPLHVAVFMGRPQESALLLAAGADVTAVDGTGRTPVETTRD